MIIERFKGSEIMFQDLNTGDVFQYCGAHFMKTDDIYNEDGDRRNCVRLDDGEFDDISIHVMVEVVNAKLIIK